MHCLIWNLSLGQLIKIIRENQMEVVVDSLINFLAGEDEELRDVSGLGQHSSLCKIMCLDAIP